MLLKIEKKGGGLPLLAAPAYVIASVAKQKCARRIQQKYACIFLLVSRNHGRRKPSIHSRGFQHPLCGRSPPRNARAQGILEDYFFNSPSCSGRVDNHIVLDLNHTEYKHPYHSSKRSFPYHHAFYSKPEAKLLQILHTHKIFPEKNILPEEARNHNNPVHSKQLSNEPWLRPPKNATHFLP